MTSKRALVVDDSKSARAFLSRILERHEITVDAAESAEAAIEYLTRTRPDVIFMDHMMPGMDGFQAVQTIKNNPRTSAIPILMYTSQEGDLYLGQARALGAEGVLPKQIKQADVTKMLYQLQLVSDRRTRDQTTFRALSRAEDLQPANESAIDLPIDNNVAAATEQPQPTVSPPDAAAQFAQLLPAMSLEIRAAFDTVLQKEIGALRTYIGATLDSHAERIQGDLAALLPATRTPDLDLPTVIPERRNWRAISGWTFAVLGMTVAAAMAWMWWQQGGELAGVRNDLAAAYAEVETLRARPTVVSPPAAEAAPVNADPFAVTPAADAPDAAAASAADVELVPVGAAATAAHTPAVVAPAVVTPPVSVLPAPAVVEQTTQAQ